jgi:hypothetical protein
MRFLFSVPRQENIDQMQGKGNIIELRKLKGCKLHQMPEMILKDTATVHVNNPKQIKEKHVRVVSEI